MKRHMKALNILFYWKIKAYLLDITGCKNEFCKLVNIVLIENFEMTPLSLIFVVDELSQKHFKFEKVIFIILDPKHRTSR